MGKPNLKWLDWNGRISAGRGGGFKREVREVFRRVLGASMVIDPVRRAIAQEIVEMMPEAWETMEAFRDDKLETIKAMEFSNDKDISGDEEKTIEDISDGEDTSDGELPNNDGQSEPGVWDAGERE